MNTFKPWTVSVLCWTISGQILNKTLRASKNTFPRHSMYITLPVQGHGPRDQLTELSLSLFCMSANNYHKIQGTKPNYSIRSTAIPWFWKHFTKSIQYLWTLKLNKTLEIRLISLMRKLWPDRQRDRPGPQS